MKPLFVAPECPYRGPTRSAGSPITPSGMTALGLLLLLTTFCHASTSELKKANRLFWKGNYEEALKAYSNQLVDAPNSSVLHFNAGAAAYQSGDAVRADTEFQKAAQSAMKPLQAAAHYNRGNALYRQSKWAEAVEAYKESLRANPQDEDAKYNLGVAMRTLKNPPKPQPQSGQGKPDKKDPKKQDGKENKPGQMSKEDAERLLAAAKANEGKKKGQQAPKPGVPHPDEDW